MIASLLPLLLADIPTTVDNLINNVLNPLIGAGVSIMIAYGGVLWMTGGSSDDIRRVNRGKTTITAAVVGGIIVFFAGQLGTTIVNNFK